MARYTFSAPLALLFLLLSTPAWCGTPTEVNSIGTVVEDNFGITRGMGGAGIADDSGWSMLHSNPAVNTTFKKPSYGFGATFSRTKSTAGNDGSFTYGGTNPNMIRFVLPLFGKAALAWGLSPFTRTDTTVKLTGNAGDTWTDTMKSSGGVNLSSFELSGNLKGVHAGIGLDYYFGAIQEDWKRDFHGADDMTNTTDYLRKEYKGYGFTFGVLAKPLKQTTVGFGYSTGSTLDRTSYLRPGKSGNSEIFLDKGKVDIPARWRLGVSTDISRRLTAAADLSIASWSSAARTETEKQQYQNTYSFGGGIRYISGLSSTASYFSTMPLSLGFRLSNQYYKSYPKVESIPERAITLGVEFPFREKSGSLITSYEIGKRGSKSSNGWEETFFVVGLTLVGSIK